MISNSFEDSFGKGDVSTPPGPLGGSVLSPAWSPWTGDGFLLAECQRVDRPEQPGRF